MPCNVWRIPKNLPGMLWESRCWTTQERNETFPSSTVSGVPRGSLADPAENLPEMGHVISRERALGRAGGKGWEGSGWGRGLGKICFIYLFSSFFFFKIFVFHFWFFNFFFPFFFKSKHVQKILCDGRKGDGSEQDVDESEEQGEGAGDFLALRPLLRPPVEASFAPDLWVFMWALRLFTLSNTLQIVR